MSHTKTIPDGYHSVQPYLILKSAADAIDFYTRAFGAKERLRMAMPDGRIGHAEIEIGDSCIMMADEHPEIGAHSVQHFGGSPVSLMVYVEDCDASCARAIAAGAVSLREPEDEPEGRRTAVIQDPFGYLWIPSSPLKNRPS